MTIMKAGPDYKCTAKELRKFKQMTYTFTHPKDAKPGHKWQTRDGREVTDVRVTARTNYPIAGCVEGGGPYVWLANGKFRYSYEPHPRDLIDAPMRCAECNCEAGDEDCNWIKVGPDYRDGKWHRWDGRDECPVDEGDEVNVYTFAVVRHLGFLDRDWET